MVLFGGADLSEWDGADTWRVHDGMAYVGEESITTKREFGDCQLHLEWSAPVSEEKRGQQKGNSGVFMMGLYEVQVHDSYQNEVRPTGMAAAIYKQRPPMVNATVESGEWNTFDIFWKCPRFEDGELVAPASVTVVQNGVLVVHGFQLQGDTAWYRPPIYRDIGPKGPIVIQDHASPVAFRNIWVRELHEPPSSERPAKYIDHSTGKEWPAEEDTREWE